MSREINPGRDAFTQLGHNNWEGVKDPNDTDEGDNTGEFVTTEQVPDPGLNPAEALEAAQEGVLDAGYEEEQEGGDVVDIKGPAMATKDVKGNPMNAEILTMDKFVLGADESVPGPVNPEDLEERPPKKPKGLYEEGRGRQPRRKGKK